MEFNAKNKTAYSVLKSTLLSISTQDNGKLDLIKRGTLIKAFKTLPDEEQLSFLKQCLYPWTLLGKRFWKPVKTLFGFKPCSFESSHIKEVCRLIKKLEPTFSVSDFKEGMRKTYKGEETMKYSG
jgi:hypothetical protein